MRRYVLVAAALCLLTTTTVAAVPLVTDVAWPKDRARRQVRLGDAVWLKVSSIAELRAAETKAGTPITLWIDGRDTKVAVEGIDTERGWLRFRLDRTEDNRDLWSDLLHNPFGETTRDIRVSAGAGAPLDAQPGTNVHLTLLKVVPVHAAAWLALLLALLIVFIYLARTTDMMRNGPRYATNEYQPYSLGRLQMAWWFILILSGFVAIAVISGDAGSVTPSLLALMGISAATALGAAAIDAKPEAQVRSTVLAAIAAKKQALAEAPNDQQLQAEMAALNRRLSAFASENWLYDILKDESGAVALHRFQIVIWTIVLGVMFVATVCRDLTMPEFSGTLLALMGISGGTYLGFKMPGTTQSGG